LELDGVLGGLNTLPQLIHELVKRSPADAGREDPAAPRALYNRVSLIIILRDGLKRAEREHIRVALAVRADHTMPGDERFPSRGEIGIHSLIIVHVLDGLE
jgi:hypothetical protein